MKALVTGATGYVGSRLVSTLLTAGHDVVATARTPAKLRDFDWSDQVEATELDVLDGDSTRAALRRSGSLDVAYYLVHAIGEGDYESSDEKAAQIFTAAAAEADVRRIVYLGGFVPAEGRMSEHLRSRSRVGEVLRDGPVDTVILQAAVILGAGSTSFEIIRHLVNRLPLVPLPPFMGHLVQPVAVDDVLNYLLVAADRDVLPAGSYAVAGEERLTYAALARLYAEVAGLRRLFVSVPFVSERLAARLIGPLVPVPTALVADLVRSLGTSMVSDDDTIRDPVPAPGGLTTLRDAIGRALTPPEPGPAAGPDAARPEGVHAQDDPLTLAGTDPDWAGENPS